MGRILIGDLLMGVNQGGSGYARRKQSKVR